jgi:hypothetical protein
MDMANMGVDAVNSTDQSNSGGSDVNTDSNTQINGTDFGDLGKTAQDLGSGDPKKVGEAINDLVAKILKAVGAEPKEEAGKGEAPPAESGGTAGGASGGGGEPEGAGAGGVEDLIKQLAEALGLSPEQTDKLMQAVNEAKGAESGEESGMEAPADATT